MEEENFRSHERLAASNGLRFLWLVI